ncbi:MAG: glycine--tRNA ligase subunit beta [Desulfovibrionaceae bacterium]|nr:glycine--tRNA ligase subunit beta [Desulfovibrionaceae bacterium]
MSTFVLEIGSEELPSRFLPGEEAFLASSFTAALDEKGLAHGAVKTCSTPRRAIVLIEDVAPVQEEKEEEVMGPPLRAAYKDNVPTRALEGFCRTHNVDVADAYVATTAKGEYMAVKKRTGGQPAADILAGVCAAVIPQIPFAKRMRWQSHDFAYARPLQWIVALLDDQVVPFAVGPVESGRETYGHRVHGRGPFTVPAAGDLMGILREKGGIEPLGSVRRETIIADADRAAAAIGGRVLWNDALMQEVVGLVEHPVSLLADFDTKYLEVPREVLLTSMQSHQKSFGVEDAEGRLMPHFVTVLNITPEDIGLVKHGWERVLRARLEDARFFWHEDLKANFDLWLEKLDHVIFIRGLGTMGEQSRRLESLCAWLAEACAPELKEKAARAGLLAKADLVSGMVGEFDTLQGIMGGIYAGKWGEAPEVAQAIGEQYLPAGPDKMPESVNGAILAMAVKADTLAGCFGLNQVPTGTADPQGLRRCAIGIIRILLKFGFEVNVRELFEHALAGYGEREWKFPASQVVDNLMAFFQGRLRNHYQALGAATPLVDAAIGAGTITVKGVDGRLAALTAFSGSESYVSSVQTFKRVANIVAKQQAAGADIPAAWNAALLQEDAEKALAAVLDEALPALDSLWAAADYAGMLARLDSLRPAVDAFFEHVMVACEDAALRGNRLAMLKAMVDRFSLLADFAALQI